MNAMNRWAALCGLALLSMLAGVAHAVPETRPPMGHAAPSFTPATSAKAAGGNVTVIEFYNAGLEHYFISADPAEIAVLDGGAFGGAWKRTGGAFLAWDITGAPADTVPVCRFFGTDRYRTNGSRIGPNSHFYTADPNECANTRVAFQSVATDGIAYPAWTFETYASAVKLPVGGACPAGTQSLYRTYNNAARGDPNHRYSTRADLLQAMAGWVFEGLVMCLPQGPSATAVGVATGSGVNATIGAAGGSVRSPDGRLTLIIPAGALAADTVIGVQPHTNLAHGKIGAAYRLTPDRQTFLKPITLAFTYTDDDLLGTAPEFLGAAYQTAEGYWQWAGDATADTTAKTVSVSSMHFSDWSKVAGLQIRPRQKTVKVKASVGLQVKVCYAAAIGELSGLGGECDSTDQGIVGTLTVDEWSVKGVLGGGSGTFGTVAGNGPTATYLAPATEPTPNTVAVSARVHNPKKGPNAKSLVASSITITEDSWAGTATASSGALSYIAEVIWTLESNVNNVATYRANGTVSVDLAGCSINPSTNVIDPEISEVLIVNFNANPPTYHGSGAAFWPATINCPPGPPLVGGVAAGFFGGSKGTLGVEAQGVVNPDGVTIEGSDTNPSGPTTFTWKFKRNDF